MALEPADGLGAVYFANSGWGTGSPSASGNSNCSTGGACTESNYA